MSSHYTDALGNDAKRFFSEIGTTHPIGFQYSDAMAARTTQELVPATSGFIDYDVTSSCDTNNRSGALTQKTINDTLYNGYVTCASCHDVHNTLNAVPSAGHSYNYFLYAKEEGSAICLSCHVK